MVDIVTDRLNNMKKELGKITAIGKYSLRIIQAAGPYLISLSKEASKSYTEHQLRLVQVDVVRNHMLKEVESLAEIKHNLRERFFESTAEDRIRIKRDVQDIEREIRRLGIVSSALKYLPDPNEDDTEVLSEAVEDHISDHWLDKFNEYARANNEEWRSELLARALASEAEIPGSIGPRALWLIGTIDEYLFHAYASILDVSIIIDDDHIIPDCLNFLKIPIPNCMLGSKKGLGSLIFMLVDLGLMGDITISSSTLSKDEKYIVSYGEKTTMLTTREDLTIRGLIPTLLGESIASLYTRKPNELGHEIYNKWIDSISEEVAYKETFE